MSSRGRKRHYSKYSTKDGNTHDKRQPASSFTISNSEVVKAFEAYREELDNKHDKYERLVKASRDLTTLSKRMIFQLHRPKSDDVTITEDVSKKIEECQGILKSIQDEVASEDFNKFHRAFTPGLQEFVEALSFLHFQTDGTIISYEDICCTYFNMSKVSTEPNTANLDCILTHMDYILGIGDLTGELMRLCINSIGAGDHENAHKLCIVLRKVYDQLVVFHVPASEFGRKLNVLRDSLKKVENACYQIHVRGSELPRHMLLDVALGSRSNMDSESSDFLAV